MSIVVRAVLVAATTVLLVVIATGLQRLRSYQEGPVTDDQFKEFSNYYYRVGSPSRAPKMLQYALSRNFDAGASDQVPLAYLFARIAQLNAGTVRGYEALWSESTHTGRLSILFILLLAGDDQTRTFLEARSRENDSKSEWTEINAALQGEIPAKFNALEQKIRTGTDLDLLWAEFIVTGSKAPVIRIVEVLAWPDRLRQHLDVWLHSRAAADPDERKRVVERLATSLGISFDPAGTQIVLVPKYDLDTLSMLEGVHISREKFEAVKKALPITLPDDDILYVSVKAAAVWSLAANAQQHPLVLEVCRDEQGKRDERTKLLLLKILTRGMV